MLLLEQLDIFAGPNIVGDSDYRLSPGGAE